MKTGASVLPFFFLLAARQSGKHGECRVMALLGPREMSDFSPQREPKRTLIRSLSPIAIL